MYIFSVLFLPVGFCKTTFEKIATLKKCITQIITKPYAVKLKNLDYNIFQINPEFAMIKLQLFCPVDF